MLLALMCFLALLASPPAGTSPPLLPSFESCEQLAAREPESEAAASCFDQTGAALKQTDKARTKLQEMLRDHPGSPWPTFFLLYRDPKALAELPRVAASFAARGDARGEVSTRVNLYRLLFNAGRVDEAGAQVAQTVRAAQASGDPELIARSQVLKARYLWGTGQDLEGAYLLLRQAEPALFPKGPYSAQRECLLTLANLNLELGRFQEGLDAFRRLAELAAKNGDSFSEANARYGTARAMLDQNAELPDEDRRREVPAAAAPLRQKRGTALERISAVQRRLLDPALPAPDRAAANQELERLEIEEADLRNQLARAAPALHSSRRPDFATLTRVRQALAADEALLSFQIAS